MNSKELNWPIVPGPNGFPVKHKPSVIFPEDTLLIRSNIITPIKQRCIGESGIEISGQQIVYPTSNFDLVLRRCILILVCIGGMNWLF